MRLRTFAATLVMTAALSGLPPSRVTAQTATRSTPAPAQTPTVDSSAFDRQNAQDTRQQLRDILDNYPPSLAQVLRLDPSLLNNQGYLAPYPALAAFLAQHPGVVRSPGYYFGELRYPFERDSRAQTISELQDIGIGIGIFLFFMTALGVIAYIGRSVLEHRRWLQATKVQTEAHTKLVDRLASNEDLLAYIQSPAGMRFLSATPIAADESRISTTSAPIGRILTSVQIGIVGAFGGLGLWIAKSRVIEEVAQPLHVIAVLALALGLGFVVSALVSYALSKQLGLIRPSSSNA